MPKNQNEDEEELKFWSQVRLNSKVEGVKYLEESAKQLITITSLLQGIYFAAISLSELKKIGDLTDNWYLLFIIISIMTIVFWISSLYCATKVLIPEIYPSKSNEKSPNQKAIETRDTYKNILEYKFCHLKYSVRLLWASFIPLALNIIIYLVFLPKS